MNATTTNTTTAQLFTAATTVAELLHAMQSGSHTKTQCLDWLYTNPVDLSTVAPLATAFPAEFGVIMASQSALLAAAQAKRDAEHAAQLAAAKAARPQQALSIKVGKRGGVSLYGLNRMPQTLYKSQWVRFLDYVGAPADSAVRVFLDSDPVGLFDPAKDFQQGDDPAYLADIKAGKVAHAKVNASTGMVEVHLSTAKD